jgi:branched-chain amino acid transport system substrate-binding protein
MKYIGLAILAIAIITAALYHNRKQTQPEAQVYPLVLGAILPQTGFVANWGENQQKGIQLALEQLGYPDTIKVIVEDSNSDAKKAVSAAEKLISINHAHILFTPFTGVTVATAPVANKANVLQLYEAAVTKPATDFPHTALKIGYYEHSRDCIQIGQYIIKKGYKRVATLVAQSDQALECVVAIKDVTGNSVILDEQKYEINKEDFRTLVSKIKTGNFDALLATGYEGDFTKLYTALAEQQVRLPVICIAREDCLLEKHIPLAPEGTVSFGGQTSPEFEQLFKSKYPNASDFDVFSAATSYTVVLFAHEASANCPNKNLDCLRNSILNSQVKPGLKTSGFVDNKLRLELSFVILRQGKVVPLLE